MCSLLQICVQYCIDVAYVVEIKLNSIQKDAELQDVIMDNWASIRTHKSHGPVQLRYTYRLTTSDTRTLEIVDFVLDQTTTFKVNRSYEFTIRKFYHSSFD